MRVPSTQDVVQHIDATQLQKKRLQDLMGDVRQFGKHQQQLLEATLVRRNEALLELLSVYAAALLHPCPEP